MLSTPFPRASAASMRRLNSTANIDGVDERVDVDVAVLDTAGYSNHPDVNVWAWANCTDSANNSDDQGHGTHVGGTIGALDNGIGVVGVAPGARLWNIRVLRADPAGGAGGMTSWLICGLDIVRQHAVPQADGLGDIEVANASFGSAGNDSNCQTQVDAYHWAFCKVVAAGVTVVVAAMNDAQDAANVVPATYEEVITVSALADSDGRPGGLGPATSAGRDDSLATFSNFGAEINIAAPGVDILSTVPTGPCELCDPSGYKRLNGTSMASPHVAGAAALYLATHPGASPAQVKNELINSRERIALPGDPDGIAEGVLYVGDGAAPPPPPHHRRLPHRRSIPAQAMGPAASRSRSRSPRATRSTRAARARRSTRPNSRKRKDQSWRRTSSMHLPDASAVPDRAGGRRCAALAARCSQARSPVWRRGSVWPRRRRRSKALGASRARNGNGTADCAARARTRARGRSAASIGERRAAPAIQAASTGRASHRTSVLLGSGGAPMGRASRQTGAALKSFLRPVTPARARSASRGRGTAERPASFRTPSAVKGGA